MRCDEPSSYSLSHSYRQVSFLLAAQTREDLDQVRMAQNVDSRHRILPNEGRSIG